MKSSMLLLVLVILALGLLSAPREPVPGAGTFPIVGRMAPDFELAGIDGPWRLSDHLGRPMVIAFWTT